MLFCKVLSRNIGIKCYHVFITIVNNAVKLNVINQKVSRPLMNMVIHVLMFIGKWINQFAYSLRFFW